jgi:excinuclease UvrABC ATPase subunit
VAAAKTENNSDKADGFSFEKMFDKILDKVADDPMQAISVGSALISAFTDTKQQDQAAAYASEMAHYRSRMDPNSSFAQEWQGAFIQDQEDSIDKHYQKARADLTASMTKRYGGIQSSTIATSALQSLDKARADLKKNLKNDAYIAYSNYARQMVAGEAQGAKIAGLGAAAAGMSGPDFQKSLAAATKAVSA